MAARRIRSKKHADRRKAARRKRLIFYTAALFIILGLFVGLTHIGGVQIDTVSVQTEADRLEKEQIVGLAEGVMDERWALLLRRDNILLLNRKDIRQEIETVSKRVRSVDIDITGLKSIRLEIENRQPVAVVCASEAVATSSCRLIDDTSYVFARADTATTTPALRLTSSDDVSAGDQLLSAEKFSLLREFIDKISDLGFQAEVVSLRRFSDAYIQTSNSDDASEQVEIRINLEEDIEAMFRNFETVVRNESFVTETESGEEVSVAPFTLEYIDLRFENKVFYR